MAIEYGAFIVDGLNVKKQTLSLAGQSIGFTDGEGFSRGPKRQRTTCFCSRKGWPCRLGAHHRLS